MRSLGYRSSHGGARGQRLLITPHMSILHGLFVLECGGKSNADAAVPLRQASSQRSGVCPSHSGRALHGIRFLDTPVCPWVHCNG
jgi:hypothetical protein